MQHIMSCMLSMGASAVSMGDHYCGPLFCSPVLTVLRAQGPHFADWAALAAAGARSMVAVPLRTEGRVAAVLCLASSQARAFEG